MYPAFLGIVERLRRIVLMRYFVASAIAFAADTGLFLILLSINLAPVPASAAAYAFGIVVHWAVSSRAVFQDDVLAAGKGRTRQKVLFTAAAGVGLTMTLAIMAAATRAHVDPRIAKLLAVATSFFVTWSLRRWVAFAPRARLGAARIGG